MSVSSLVQMFRFAGSGSAGQKRKETAYRQTEASGEDAALMSHDWH